MKLIDKYEVIKIKKGWITKALDRKAVKNGMPIGLRT